MDEPDLRTLAAEVMCNAFDSMLDDDHRGTPPQPVFAGTTSPPRPVEVPCSGCRVAADAVLAAVLPAHRRQVLTEAADHLAARVSQAHSAGRLNAGLDRVYGFQEAQTVVRHLAEIVQPVEDGGDGG